MKHLFALFLPFLLLSAVVLWARPSVTLAAEEAPANYTLMAPLTGYLTGSPDLTTYLSGAVQVTIGLAGILAVVMIVVCGLKLMGSPSASGRSEAKECIWNAVFGVLLAIGAWILLNTINPLLLTNELNLTNVAVAPATGTGGTTIPFGIYQWSAGTSCTPVTGKIVSAVPPSYCSGSAPSESSPCCGYVDSPFRGETGNPVVQSWVNFMTTGVTDPAPSTTATFSASNYTVNESVGSLTMSATRTSGGGAGTINYFTSSGGATQGADYQNTSGTLVFAEGITARTFSVLIINDTLPESQEGIAVTLSSPAGGIGVGAIGSTLINIVDNDPPTTPDTTAPVVTISSPESNRATTSAIIPVTFTASDNLFIRRLEYTYTPPSPGVSQTITICNTDCVSPTITMTAQVAIDAAMPGTHTIAIRVCDRQQCYSRQTTVIIEAPCVSTTNVTCKVLPTGPGQYFLGSLCAAPYTGIQGISVGLNTDAYAFKIIRDDGGGIVRISGGNQPEWPRAVSRFPFCPNPPSQWCIYHPDEYWSDGNSSYLITAAWWECLPSFPNVVVSISASPGDLSSNSATVFDLNKRVSGYCGNGGSTGAAQQTLTISANSSGPDICTVEKYRTYYVNITTLTFLAAGNALYSLFWDFVP